MSKAPDEYYVATMHYRVTSSGPTGGPIDHWSVIGCLEDCDGIEPVDRLGPFESRFDAYTALSKLLSQRYKSGDS